MQGSVSAQDMIQRLQVYSDIRQCIGGQGELTGGSRLEDESRAKV